jgi:DNA-nicking Smr family endonuclease
MKQRNHPLAPPPRPVKNSQPANVAPVPAPTQTPIKTVKSHTLQDLKAIRQQLLKQQADALAQKQAEQAAHIAALRARHLFAYSVGQVTPLPQRNQVPLAPLPPPPLALQHQLDEQSVLRESLSDDFDVSTLLETDDTLSYRRPGVGVDVIRRLRKGEWTLPRQLDLHGMRTDQAREALGQFIRDALISGVRCIRVVHGKGLGSPGKNPVLKSRVHSWLVQKDDVLAFVQARGDEGGAGAVVVLLRSGRHKRNTNRTHKTKP